MPSSHDYAEELMLTTKMDLVQKPGVDLVETESEGFGLHRATVFLVEDGVKVIVDFRQEPDEGSP